MLHAGGCNSVLVDALMDADSALGGNDMQVVPLIERWIQSALLHICASVHA